MRIALISCAKTKTAFPASARELYSPSRLFRKAITYVEPSSDLIYILSAKYGLVTLDQPLEPYELTLKTMRQGVRVAWARQVFAEIQRRHGKDLTNLTFEFHTGEEYRANLVPLLTQADATCTCPVEGLAIGERMQFYDRKSPTPAPLPKQKSPPPAAAAREQASVVHRTTFDTIWRRIVAHGGQTFCQVRGGEFHYEMIGPHSLRLSSVNQNLSYAILEQAYALVPLTNTGPVQHLRAPSYLYAILMDPRIRQTDW